MPTKEEKERRKALQQEYQHKQQQAEFEAGLPMGRMLFTDLFNFLDEQLSENECDNDMTLTKAWLEVNSPGNAGQVLKWLAKHGGYCDCEVLMNVEECFE